MAFASSGVPDSLSIASTVYPKEAKMVENRKKGNSSNLKHYVRRIMSEIVI